MLVAISSSTETTQGLSRVGGDISTATEWSMMSSEGFTSSLTIYPDISRSLPLTSQVCSIQQMTHPEASLAQTNFFSLPSIFPQNLMSSSSIQQSLSPLPNSIICMTGLTPLLLASSSIKNLSNNKQQSGPEPPKLRKKVSLGQPSKTNDSSRVSHFGALIMSIMTLPSTTPKNYKPALTPRPSSLCPHCLARDRLRLWSQSGTSPRLLQLTATSGSQQGAEIIDTQLDRILNVMGSSWVQSMKETYGAGLLVFHILLWTGIGSNDLDSK